MGHRHFNTNVLGAYLTIQEAVKLFDGKGGSIINIGTAGTPSTRPDSALYTSTKGALGIITGEQYCQTLAEAIFPSATGR